MTTLNSGQQLAPGQTIASDNGLYSLTLQEDGNFVLYRGGSPLWNTHTNGKPVATAIMQDDGNLVLYDAQKHALWNSGTSGHPGAYLAVQDDGNLVIYTMRVPLIASTPIWATMTNSIGAVLRSAQQLIPGQAMTSTNGLYTLTLQGDGNFVLYKGATALWNTHTNGQAVTKAVMQADGNLVLYDSQQHPLWNCGTEGHAGAYLTVQDDGNVVVGVPLPLFPGYVIPFWATNTAASPTTQQAHFNITFDDGTPVGGWADLTLNANGSYVVRGHLHDSGIPDYNFSVVLAVRDNTGVLYAFSAIGSVQGTQSGFNPNRDADWGTTGLNSAIAGAWNNIPNPGPAWVCKISVVFDADALMNEIVNDIEQVIGVVEKVVQVVEPILVAVAA